MSITVKIDNKLPMFTSKLKKNLDDAVKEAARDTLIESHRKAPFRKGGLRSKTETKPIGYLKMRVSYNKEYARYQEAGGDGRRKVRNYTTPGTGAHFLESSGDNQARKLANKIKKHAKRTHV